VTRLLKPAAASLASVLFAITLTGCASEGAPPPGDPIVLTPQTSAALTSYLRAVRVTRPGAFAVSPDGANSFYAYCGTLACNVTNYTIPAQRGCQSLTGTPCLVLYVRDDPRFAFTRGENDLPGRHGSQRQEDVDFDRPGSD
jgi:hypothetical protein